MKISEGLKGTLKMILETIKKLVKKNNELEQKLYLIETDIFKEKARRDLISSGKLVLLLLSPILTNFFKISKTIISKNF